MTAQVLKTCNNCERDRRRMAEGVNKAYCRCCKGRSGWSPLTDEMVVADERAQRKIEVFLAWMDEQTERAA